MVEVIVAVTLIVISRHDLLSPSAIAMGEGVKDVRPLVAWSYQ